VARSNERATGRKGKVREKGKDDDKDGRARGEATTLEGNEEGDAKARGKSTSQLREWSLVFGKCDGEMMVMMIAMMMAPRCGCG
jgi:hypothetical protein